MHETSRRDEMIETRDVFGLDRDKIRDAEVRDQDETETLGTLVETRRWYVSRPYRDRDHIPASKMSEQVNRKSIAA